MITQNHYHILQIPYNATKKQIKDNFYKLSFIYHPDISKEEDSKRKFIDLLNAYETLNNDNKKSEYDRQNNIDSHIQHAKSPTFKQHIHTSFYPLKWANKTSQYNKSLWDSYIKQRKEPPTPSNEQVFIHNQNLIYLAEYFIGIAGITTTVILFFFNLLAIESRATHEYLGN